MKRNFYFVVMAAALVMVLGWFGPAQAYTVTGSVTPGCVTADGGNLWYDVLHETAGSTAGQYDDVGTNPPGCIERPPTTQGLPNPLSPTNHNWIMVNYLLVTGKNGQQALYSVGELDPRFGNKTATLTKNKKDYDLSGEGREVNKVVNIDVVHAFTNIKDVPNDARPYAPWLVVSGAGITPRTYDLAALQAMPQVTFDASSSTTNTRGTWTGPTLKSVLEKAGVDTRDMESYLIVQGADGYASLFSMYEATHQIGLTDQSTCTGCVPEYALLAIEGVRSGQQQLNNGTCTDPESAGTACKDGGIVRTVLPGDQAAGRWVSNTAQIIVYKLDRKKGCGHHHGH